MCLFSFRKHFYGFIFELKKVMEAVQNPSKNLVESNLNVREGRTKESD